MTEPPELPPEQEAVRRLLADARHDGPTPPEVVARLDATLASLAAEREPAPATSHTTAPVIDLGARRRRMAGIGLLAAAAVVVAGVAIGQGLPSMQGGSDAGSASAGDAATSQRELQRRTPPAVPTPAAPRARRCAADRSRARPPRLGGVPRALLRRRRPRRGAALARARRPRASDGGDVCRAAAECDLAGTGRGRQVLARGRRAVGAVVFRRADGASQQVDLYVCGDPTTVRTLTLPAP